MNPGRLRHRIHLQSRVTSQDEHGGEIVTWSTFAADVPAYIKSVSGREFLAGQGIVGQVTEDIVIRWRHDVVPTMRAIHYTDVGSPLRYDVYNISAVLSDDETRRQWLTLKCSRGVNEG